MSGTGLTALVRLGRPRARVRDHDTSRSAASLLSNVADGFLDRDGSAPGTATAMATARMIGVPPGVGGQAVIVDTLTKKRDDQTRDGEDDPGDH